MPAKEGGSELRFQPWEPFHGHTTAKYSLILLQPIWFNFIWASVKTVAPAFHENTYFNHILCFQSSHLGRLRLANADKEWPTLSCNPWTYKLEENAYQASKRFWLKLDTGCENSVLTPQITSRGNSKIPTNFSGITIAPLVWVPCANMELLHKQKEFWEKYTEHWKMQEKIDTFLCKWQKNIHWQIQTEVSLTIKSSGAGLSFGSFFMLCHKTKCSYQNNCSFILHV